MRYAVVTTLSEATPEPGVEDGYAGTRAFWQRCGFEPVWEPAGWWNEVNQAVVMIRPLKRVSPPSVTGERAQRVVGQSGKRARPTWGTPLMASIRPPT